MYQSNSAGGVISGDGPYHWLDPRQYFTGEATGGKAGFWSEIGIPTVSVVESMRNLVGAGESGLADRPVRGTCTTGRRRATRHRRRTWPRSTPGWRRPAALEEFCRKAQFVNYESMRAIFEAWNAKLWNDARGVLLWMSHPAWHSTVWQTYDYDLDVNGSYYGSRKGCEAHHVQASLSTWQVSAVNHTPIAVTGGDCRRATVRPDRQPRSAARSSRPWTSRRRR